MPEDGDSGAAISAQRFAGDGGSEGERSGGVDPVGLVAAAKGLAECMDIRKAGGWPNDYGTSAAPHKGVFGAIPSALLCTLARPHGRPPGPRP